MQVEERALGAEVLDGVTPDVQLVKIVNDELVELMGQAGNKDLEPGTPQVILMAGLQVGRPRCRLQQLPCLFLLLLPRAEFGYIVCR